MALVLYKPPPEEPVEDAKDTRADSTVSRDSEIYFNQPTITVKSSTPESDITSDKHVTHGESRVKFYINDEDGAENEVVAHNSDEEKDHFAFTEEVTVATEL